MRNPKFLFCEKKSLLQICNKNTTWKMWGQSLFNTPSKWAPEQNTEKNIFQNLWFRRFQSKFSGKRPKKGQKKGPTGLNASKKDRLFLRFFKRRPSPTRCLASRMSFGYPHPTGRWPKTRTAEWKKLFLYKGFCLQKYQQEPGYIRIGIRMIISPPLIWISDSRIGCVE